MPNLFEGWHYTPIENHSALAVCTECGAVIEGDVTGQNRHDIWHKRLAELERAAKPSRALRRM